MIWAIAFYVLAWSIMIGALAWRAVVVPRYRRQRNFAQKALAALRAVDDPALRSPLMPRVSQRDAGLAGSNGL